MTIRQYIKQRLWLAVLVGNAVWIGACLLFYITRPRALHENEMVPVVLLVALLFFGPEFVVRSSIRCPNCSVRIGHRMSQFGSEPKQCPSCGIDLDEPMPTMRPSTKSNEVEETSELTRRVRLLQGKDDL